MRYHKRLKKAVLTDRVGQLLKLGLCELSAGLEGVGHDAGQGDLPEFILSRWILDVGTQQRAEAPTESILVPSGHGYPPGAGWTEADSAAVRLMSSRANAM